METARLNLDRLGIDPAMIPVVTRDQVKYAKPDPDLFLAAVDRLGAKIEHSVVIGDSSDLCDLCAMLSPCVCFSPRC